MVTAGDRSEGYSVATTAASAGDFDFFKQSHLNISKLPLLDQQSKHKQHSYWRIYQHVLVRNSMHDPKSRGVSRITTRRLHKTLYGDYPDTPDHKMTRSKTLEPLKLPSLDTRLGAKSVYWNWNSLSEDIRKGKVSNFQQLKIGPIKGSGITEDVLVQEPTGFRWHRADNYYNYKISPRYHVQFLDDIHQTRRLGWKGNTKVARSAKRAKEVHEEPEEEADEDLQQMEKQEEEFDAVLATNISGLDDMPAGDTSGDNNLLGDISLGDLNDSKQDADDKSVEDEEEPEEPTEDQSAHEELSGEREDQGLAEIKEVPELE